MSGESDFLDKLAQSIADGASIKWEEIDRLPADDDLRRLLKLLRIVDGVAEGHRSPAHDVRGVLVRFSVRRLRVQPLGGRWVAGYTGRLYPNGFTNDEFGFAPRLVNVDRKREWVHGAGLSFAW